MSEEEEKKKDSLAVGRFLAIIAKRNPELFKRFKELTEMERVSATDVIEEALAMYLDFKSLKFLDERVFMMMKLIEYVTRWQLSALSMYMQLISLTTPQVAEEEEVEEKERKEKAAVKAKIVEAMLPLLTSMMSTILSSIARLSPQAQQQTLQQMQQPQLPIQQPRKIPVVIKKGEEKEKSEG